MDKIGIVILNYNTGAETDLCIRSILKYTTEVYHIYLIDNASSDDATKILKKKYENVEYITIITNEKNNGYSAGNNIGIKRAICDDCNIIFIINSDVELLNNALGRMKDTLLKNTDCMIVGPSVLNNEKKESQLAKRKLTWKTFLFERHPLCYLSYFKRRAERTYKIPDTGKFVFQGMVSGCCFGIRSEDMERIEYLDDKVFLYYEEDILAYKMELLHKTAIVDCGAKIWHKESVSTNKKGGAFIRFHRWLSVFYLLKKYAGIEKWKQYFIFLSNVITWMIKSLGSREYRKYLKLFVRKNMTILKS